MRPSTIVLEEWFPRRPPEEEGRGLLVTRRGDDCRLVLPGLLKVDAEAAAASGSDALMSVGDDVSHGGRCNRDFCFLSSLLARGRMRRCRCRRAET